MTKKKRVHPALWLLISLASLGLVACIPVTGDETAVSSDDFVTVAPEEQTTESTPEQSENEDISNIDNAEEPLDVDESFESPKEEEIDLVETEELEAAEKEADAGESNDEKAEAENSEGAIGSTDNVTADTASNDQPTDTPEPLVENGIFLEDDRPENLRFATEGWNTNWKRHNIDYEEFLSGGPPRDGIPAIDDPLFVTLDEAGEWLAFNEPVIALELNGDARAYPLQILMWHEIANDIVGDVPVIVTFCPLCNSALVFDRRIDGETYEFGTSGLLRNSDLVMYDRTTESLWQQFTGEGIVGDLTGEQLTFLPSSLVSFANFRDAFPKGIVLSQETGFERAYGVNPYSGYDTYENPLSLDGNIAHLKIEQDGRLPAAERVVTVTLDEAAVDIAYPLSILSKVSVINDLQGGQDITVFFTPGTSSALGSQLIASGEDVGATGVFNSNLEGQKLTFSQQDERLVDNETGSSWNILGQATDGPLVGKSLEPVVHGDHFWFSWAAFKPETIIYQN